MGSAKPRGLSDVVSGTDPATVGKSQDHNGAGGNGRPKGYPNGATDGNASSQLPVPDNEYRMASGVHTLMRNLRNPRESIAQLATDFLEAVGSSHQYSWIGLFETQDAYHRTRLVIYLLECSGSASQNDGRVAGPSIGSLFSKLALAMRPSVFLDLYRYDSSAFENGRMFCNDIPDDALVKLALEDIRSRYELNDPVPEDALQWSSRFPLPSHPGR